MAQLSEADVLCTSFAAKSALLARAPAEAFEAARRRLGLLADVLEAAAAEAEEASARECETVQGKAIVGAKAVVIR